MKLVMTSTLKGVTEHDLDLIIQEQLDAIGSDAMGIQFKTRYKPRKKETEVKFIFNISEVSSPNLFWHTQVSVREDALDILHGLAEEIFQEGGEYTVGGRKYDVEEGRRYNIFDVEADDLDWWLDHRAAKRGDPY